MRRSDLFLIIGISALMLGITAGGVALLVWQHARAGGFELDPADAPIYMADARDRMARRDLAGAIDSYTRAIEADPQLIGAYLERANARKMTGDDRAAADDYHAAHQIDPENRKALHEMARFFAESSPEMAVDFLNRAVDADPRDFEALRLRAYLHDRLRDFESALADLDALVRQTSNPETLAFRAQVRLHVGDAEGSLADIQTIRATSRDGPQTDRDAGWARWAMDDYEAALDEFNAAVSRDPREPHSFFGRGSTYLMLGRAEKAVEDLEHAARLGLGATDYPCLYLWIARARAEGVETADRELRESVEGDRFHDRWARMIARFLIGDVTEQALLDEASEPDRLSVDEKMCEALWYAGAKRLIAGDEEAATALFKGCIATDMRHYYEYYSARAELQRRRE